MLKDLIRSGFLVLVLVAALQATGCAETIEGRVERTDYAGLDVIVYDSRGRPYPNALHLKVDASTRMSGVRSLRELRRGDPVMADVSQEESGLWHADRVALLQQIDVQPATQQPSPSLRGALGNPVVRGALTGAATGAIAASASDGEAGKGALIGAGVGAAAGLLDNLFGQPSAPSSDADNR